MKKLLIYIPLMMMVASCSHKNTESVTNDSSVTKQATVGGVAVGYRNSRPVNAIPKATAFRMNGNYADQVAITLNPDGSLTYFPDPKDITDNSKPVDLGNGWWLNRQGISANSVFTRYTFSEYQTLKNVPSIEQLKASVIPDARVTEMRQLPFSIYEVPENLDSIKKYLASPSGKFKVTINPRR